jgi:hypothetical protein
VDWFGGDCGRIQTWRRLGRVGNTTGVGGSVLDVTRGGAQGGTETGFEIEIVMVDDVSLILPSSCGRR